MASNRSRRALAAHAFSMAIAASAATGFTVIGLMSNPLSASADPPCTNWVFDGRFQFDQGTGQAVTFTLQGKEFPPEGVRAVAAGRGTMVGSARGGSREVVAAGIDGRYIGFTIWWESGPVGNYFGSIDDAGIASGTTYDKNLPGAPQQDRGWKARTPLKCVPPDPMFVPDRGINPIAPDATLAPDVTTFEPGDPNSPFGD